MPDHAAHFASAAPGVTRVESLHERPCLHVYAGRLEDHPEEVRFLTLAPTVTETAVVSRFERALEEWADHESHPTVTTVYAQGETPRPWIAVAADGVALTDATDLLSPEELRTVVGDVAEALRHATRGEREYVPIGPDDVRVVRNGDAVSARLDWPLDAACRIEGDSGTSAPAIAPEVRVDPETATERATVFGLGTLAYYGATGQVPGATGEDVDEEAVAAPRQNPPSPSSVNPDLPDAFDDVIERALAPDPENRYASCYEFKLALTFDTHPDRQSDLGHDFDVEPGQSVKTDTDAGGKGESALTRRTALGALGLGIVGAAVGGAWLATRPQQSETVTTYPMFRYDQQNTGYVPGASAPTDGVTEAWSFETGDEVLSSPVVWDGTVLIGSNDRFVYALDVEEGVERWSREVGDWVIISPAIADGTAYLITSVDESTVRALDPDDGTEQWAKQESGLNLRPPVVTSERLYVTSSDTIHALDRQERTEDWVVEHGFMSSLSPAVGGDTLYYGGSVDLQDGSERVRGLIALDTADGSERWRFDSDTLVISSPAVVDETVYIGDEAGHVYALDTADGSERWTFTADDSVPSSPAVADLPDGEQTVYVGSEDQHVYALDAETGEQRWRFETEGTVISSPAVAGKTVYVGCGDGNVYALDANEGEKRWRFETDGAVISSPAVIDDWLFVGSADGNLYALTEPE